MIGIVMNKKVAQIGTFDLENFGDLLFPTVLKEVMRKHQIDVDLFSPYGGPMPFEEETFVHPIMNLENRILSEHYSAIVIGGGDLIRIDSFIAQDYEKTINNSLLLWQWPIILAKKYGIPALFNAPGVPFYFNENNQRIVKYLIDNVDYVSVRDYSSAQILKDCSLNKVNVVPDSVFFIDKAFPREYLNSIFTKLQTENKIPTIQDYIIFQHNKSKIRDISYIKKLKETIAKIAEDEKNILFMPIGYVHDDQSFMEKIYDSSDGKQYFVNEKLKPIEMLAVIANSNGFIGTSMHGIVTSYTYEKPIIILNPSRLTKINGISEITGLEDANSKNINDALTYYNDQFNRQSSSRKQDIDKRISEHFDKIISLIDNNSINAVPNFEVSFLGVCQSDETMQYKGTRYIKIYYDEGSGFSENGVEFRPYSASKNRVCECINTAENIKSIRIDPIENEIISIDEISITSNGKKIDYDVEDLITLNNENIVLSYDPKITIETQGCSEIKFELKFTTLNSIGKETLISNLKDKDNLTKERINDLENYITELKSRKIYKIARKIDKYNKRK